MAIVRQLSKKEIFMLEEYLNILKSGYTLDLDDTYFDSKVICIHNSSIDIKLIYGFGKRKFNEYIEYITVKRISLEKTLNKLKKEYNLC